jgi:hypothetical protein
MAGRPDPSDRHPVVSTPLCVEWTTLNGIQRTFPRDDRQPTGKLSCTSYAAELPIRCTSADGVPHHGEDFNQSLGFRHG